MRGLSVPYNAVVPQMRKSLCLVAALAASFAPGPVVAQSLTGELIVTVRDSQGLALTGAEVRVSSPALIGGPRRQATG